MTQNSGESIGRSTPRKRIRKTDPWFGGTGDLHLQAAELGLTVPIRRRCWTSCILGEGAVADFRAEEVGTTPGAGYGLQHEVLAKKICRSPVMLT
jgi:iron(III) transport system substrate-binding protein